MNTDLEDRLRSFNVSTTEFTPDRIVARVRRRRRNRRLVASSISATLALAATFVLIAINGNADSQSIVPASDQAVTTHSAASSSEPAASPTTEPSTRPETSDPGEEVSLVGADGGLYIDAGVLPDDMLLTGASRLDGSLGSGSSEFGVWSTTLAKYSDDRSTVAERINIDTLRLPADRTPVSLIGENGATTAQLRGTTVWFNGPSAAWAEGPWTIVAGGNAAAEDVVHVVEALHIADDGRVAVPSAPAGFETVGVLPNRQTDFGPRWTTGYVTPDATTYDEPVLKLVVTAGPARPAEYLLVEAFSGDRTYATTVLGRRAILSTSSYGSRLSATLTWDESDGAQIVLTYSPMRRDLSDDELVQQVLSLASGVRRANATTWAELGTQAATAMAEFAGDLNDPQWVRELLADLDLTMTGLRHADFTEPALLIADVQEPDGTAAACEIFLRQVIACTRADESITESATAEAIDGGYLRLLVTADTRFVRLNDSVSGLGRNTDPLFPIDTQPNSLRVVYLRASASGEKACIELRDETDTTALAAFDIQSSSLSPRSNSCADN